MNIMENFSLLPLKSEPHTKIPTSTLSFLAKVGARTLLPCFPLLLPTCHGHGICEGEKFLCGDYVPPAHYTPEAPPQWTNISLITSSLDSVLLCPYCQGHQRHCRHHDRDNDAYRCVIFQF